MASEKRLIDVNALIAKYDRIHVGEPGKARKLMEDAPTVDAVEVDVVAQMLCNAFGDTCPCNYNGNDEWLPLVCDDGIVCGKHDDPLCCWKQYIKHYGERKDNERKAD